MLPYSNTLFSMEVINLYDCVFDMILQLYQDHQPGSRATLACFFRVAQNNSFLLAHQRRF